MTDEKFTFIEDLREKKKTATGAHHKRTHCGKGGAIRFPSDYMTKKEREAMNGEVKSYKLNDPMSWKEFKAMPDDIKIAYIKALRQRYNVSDTALAGMFGVSQPVVSKEMRRLDTGSCGRGANTKWDADGWYAWLNGVPVEAKGEAFEVAQEIAAAAEAAPESEKCDEEVLEQAEKCDAGVDRAVHKVFLHFNEKGISLSKAEKPAVPRIGQMELEGTVAECAETLQMLLADSRVKLTVAWAVKQDG